MRFRRGNFKDNSNLTWVFVGFLIILVLLRSGVWLVGNFGGEKMRLLVVFFGGVGEEMISR